MAKTYNSFQELGKALGYDDSTLASPSAVKAGQIIQNRSNSVQSEGKYRGDSSGNKQQDAAFISEDYIARAEKVIRSIGREDKYNPGKLRFTLTTSKIRGILTLVNRIYNEVTTRHTEEKMSEELQERIQYLRVRIIYEAGRDEAVAQFIQASGILSEIQKIGDSKKKFMEFERYMEALVAYHRFLGGKD